MIQAFTRDGRRMSSVAHDPMSNHGTMLDLTTTMSPLTLSRTSRTKKSMLALPIPMLTMEIGTPLYLPVMVRKLRSVVTRNGEGEASRNVAMRSALEGEPTVTWNHEDIMQCERVFSMVMLAELTIRFATSPARMPK